MNTSNMKQQNIIIIGATSGIGKALFEKYAADGNRILNKVPWMSGLVYGLQNRPRRFESARHLSANPSLTSERGFFV